MTTKQAEYLALQFDAREYTQAGASAEFKRRVQANLKREISADELEEIIANFPDFPRNGE